MRSLTFLVVMLVSAGYLSACAGPQPKIMYSGERLPEARVAKVDPGIPLKGMMLLTHVDGQSTYGAAWGFAGGVYILPGTHLFKVEVSLEPVFGELDWAAWAPPEGVRTYPLQQTSGSLMVNGYEGTLEGSVEAGGVYTVRYGFTRLESNQRQHVVWLQHAE